MYSILQVLRNRRAAVQNEVELFERGLSFWKRFLRKIRECLRFVRSCIYDFSTYFPPKEIYIGGHQMNICQHLLQPVTEQSEKDGERIKENGCSFAFLHVWLEINDHLQPFPQQILRNVRICSGTLFSRRHSTRNLTPLKIQFLNLYEKLNNYQTLV